MTNTNKTPVEYEAIIADLNERLKTSLHMDTIAKNTELETLKASISDCLKLEHEDHATLKTREYSVDNYEAYKAMTTRIFKVLKRHGINL